MHIYQLLWLYLKESKSLMYIIDGYLWNMNQSDYTFKIVTTNIGQMSDADAHAALPKP